MIGNEITWAQQVLEDLPIPRPFISNVQLFAGSSLNFPDDNGWYDRINSGSQGLISGEYRMKIGYLAGIGIAHSAGSHFEINGRLAWDRRGYLQQSSTLGDNNNIRKYEANAQNDYITGSIALDFFVKKNARLYISSGVAYSYLVKSFIAETSYLNNQIAQQSSITNSPEINDYDIGVLFATGYIVPINNKMKLDLRVQGNYGLTDIVNVNGLVINSNSLNFFIIIKTK